MLLLHTTHHYHANMNYHTLLVVVKKHEYNLTYYHQLLFIFFHLYKASGALINEFLDDSLQHKLTSNWIKP
jgi:hypothetical protein